MRLDKLTTKFQEALGDAQSLALGNDNAYIEPVHLLAAMLRQAEGPKSLLQRAGVDTARLAQEAEAAVKRLPSVTGQQKHTPMVQNHLAHICNQVQIGVKPVEIGRDTAKHGICGHASIGVPLGKELCQTGKG